MSTKGELHYRGYVFYHDGTEWVAEAEVPDNPVFEIGSQDVARLMSLIDELWESLAAIEAGQPFGASLPTWYATYLQTNMDMRVHPDQAPGEAEFWEEDPSQFEPRDIVMANGGVSLVEDARIGVAMMVEAVVPDYNFTIVEYAKYVAVPATFIGAAVAAPAIGVIPIVCLVAASGASPFLKRFLEKKLAKNTVDLIPV